MLILLVITWFLFGALGVFLAGKVDKMLEVKDCAPLFILFILGPLSFLVCLGMLMIFYEKNNTKTSYNPLKKLYNLGNKDD